MTDTLRCPRCSGHAFSVHLEHRLICCCDCQQYLALTQSADSLVGRIQGAAA